MAGRTGAPTSPVAGPASPGGGAHGAGGAATWHRLPAVELRSLYRAYRRREGRRLLDLLPRERIRPLYRAALEARPEAADPHADPLEMLVEHCAGLLPLPPFRVWLADLERHPEEHLLDLGESGEAPTPARPLTLAERTFLGRDGARLARLRAFQAEGAWRGYVCFPSDGDAEAGPRTAVVFREADPAALRARFLEFEDRSLEAFLRSASG